MAHNKKYDVYIQIVHLNLLEELGLVYRKDRVRIRMPIMNNNH